MNLKLIEPLKEFFKDEVNFSNSLGLSKSISKRHPFPGPGLGIRIMEKLLWKELKYYKKQTIFL